MMKVMMMMMKVMMERRGKWREKRDELKNNVQLEIGLN